ncbi:MAG TPA: glycosyltransferase [Kineosporiaceae bacterium]
MRIAIAHDYITQRGGAERVVLSLARGFPGAPIYTSVYHPDGTYPEFAGHDIRVSPLQRVAAFRRDPRLALPLLASVWRGIVVRDVDAVLVSSSGWAHGVSVPDGVPKVVYCHNPARWLYQSDEYAVGLAQAALIRVLRRPLVRWDRTGARSAQLYLANSANVAARIARAYGIGARVLHPPVTIDVTAPQRPVPALADGPFWVTVNRGRAYKNVREVVAGVLRRPGDRVAVVGAPDPHLLDGVPAADRHRVRVLGVVGDAELRWLYANARGLISVGHEDFGLTPLEANAFGTPVLALRAGGFLETVVENVSGVFVDEPCGDQIAPALDRLAGLRPERIRRHAATFSQDVFVARVRAELARVLGRLDLDVFEPPAAREPVGIRGIR